MSYCIQTQVWTPDKRFLESKQAVFGVQTLVWKNWIPDKRFLESKL
jgi:hypothetical protein